MPLPILGLAARGILGAGGAGLSGRALAPTFRVSLSRGGRGIRRKIRAITRRANRAADRATARTGQIARMRVSEIMRREAGAKTKTAVKPKSKFVRGTAKRRATYTTTWPAAIPIKALASVQFKPARRGGPGRLSFKALSGRDVEFHGVVKTGKGRGVGYRLPTVGDKAARGVGGVKFIEGRTAAINRYKRRELKREYRRQFRSARRALVRRR